MRASSLTQIALIWLALGLVTGTQVVVGMGAVGMQHRWGALFLLWTVSWLIWAFATPTVLSLGHRFPIMEAGGWKNLWIHLGAALAIGTGDAIWFGGLEFAMNPLGSPPGSTFRFLTISAFYSRFHVGLIVYAALLAIAHTIDSIQRLANREAELTKAQLDVLRRQIEPHFLFNTLNGIAGLVRENRNRDAVGMISGLSDLLRRSLESSGRQLVPLAEELSFLESYIDVQQMRFGDRLKVTVEVPLELYGALVPGLILQPLIENAIMHGIGKRIAGGKISISAGVAGGTLTLRVHNDGPELPALATKTRAGVGLSNTQGRLQTLYGAASALTLRNHRQTGVETIVEMPYRVA